jgi:hypothetical protein
MILIPSHEVNNNGAHQSWMHMRRASCSRKEAHHFRFAPRRWRLGFRQGLGISCSSHLQMRATSEEDEATTQRAKVMGLVLRKCDGLASS